MKSNRAEKKPSSKKQSVQFENLRMYFLQQVTPKNGNNYICEIVCRNETEAWEMLEKEYGFLPRWKEGRNYGFRIFRINPIPGREMPPFSHLKKVTPIQQKAKYRGKS